MKIKKIRPEDEWLKWLSYEPELTKLVKEDLNSKEVSQLSLAELDLVRSFRIQERMLELFKEYNTGAFTKDTLKEIKEKQKKDLGKGDRINEKNKRTKTSKQKNTSIKKSKPKNKVR